MTEHIPERNGSPIPLPSLRLLVPPLRLVSAAIWQTVQRRQFMDYGMLEEFVTMVTEIVPELLHHTQRAQLILGLRARLVLELCRSNPITDLQTIQPHLDRILTLTPLWGRHANDSEGRLSEWNFIGLVQTILKDPAERKHFFDDIFPVEFGYNFDVAIQKLLGQFLLRLEELLPVVNFKQAASLLSDAPSVLEECVESVSDPQHLKTLLEYHRDLDQLDSYDTLSLSDGNCILSALCFPHVERVEITTEQTESELSLNVYMETFTKELEVESTEVGESTDVEVVESTDVEVVESTDVEVVESTDVEVVESTDVEVVESTDVEVVESTDVEVVESTDVEVVESTDVEVVESTEVEVGESTEVEVGESTEVEVGEATDVEVGSLRMWRWGVYGCGDMTKHMQTHKNGRPHQCFNCHKTFKHLYTLQTHRQTCSFEPEQAEEVSLTDAGGSPMPTCEEEIAQSSIDRRTCKVCGKIVHRIGYLCTHMKIHTKNRNHLPGGGQPIQNLGGGGQPIQNLGGGGQPIQNLGGGQPIQDLGGGGQPIQNLGGGGQPIQNLGGGGQPIQNLGGGGQPIQKLGDPEPSSGAPVEDSDSSSTSTTQDPSYQPEPSHTKKPKCSSTAKRPYRKSFLRQKHMCRICGKYVSAGVFEYHMRIHSDERPFSCPHPQCGMKFIHSGGLRAHLRSFCKVRTVDAIELDSFNIRFECDKCDKTFTIQSKLRKHKLTHGPLYCIGCKKVLPNVETLNRHKLWHRQVKCTMCEETFMFTNLKTHYLDVHQFSGPYVCTHCPKTYKKFYSLIKHEMVHTGTSPLQCSHCPKRFIYNYDLVEHEKRHSGDRPCLCWECGKAFFTNLDLQNHMKSSHGEKPTEYRYPCRQCGKPFRLSNSRANHEKTKHGGVRHACTYCGKEYVCADGLKRHNLIHTGERPFKCNYDSCEKGFRSKAELTIHMRYHTGERPFRCNVCGKGFVQANFLTTHYRTHTGEKPYSCILCDKSFNNHNGLKRHMFTHSDEKPHKCLDCGKAFQRKTLLNVHQRSCTPKDGKLASPQA
ncbi:hypothetical protein DPEC_G00318260 [Dallia pectoralis]|uniref:Uncharacterized protein n=1 Tax=Dallia pectoralis TaxID=75939 RepID=A0ACC2F939_DALPE|nr:hypothetical protein DPEC_G00318260 [Dallia pectoralis]